MAFPKLQLSMKRPNGLSCSAASRVAIDDVSALTWRDIGDNGWMVSAKANALNQSLAADRNGCKPSQKVFDIACFLYNKC